MKKMLFLMIALLAVFSVTTGAFAADSIDNEAVAMTLDWDEAAASLTLYQEDGTTGVVSNAMDIVKSSMLSLGDDDSYVGGLIYATVGGGAQPWKLAIVTEGNDRESNLPHSEFPLKTMAFKVECKQEAAEDTTITDADFLANYAYMRKEIDTSVNIFVAGRSADLAAATMMWYGDTYMSTHTQIPFSFGVHVGVPADNLVGGEYTTAVKFLLYYE